MKRTGTRYQVFNGLATQTTGGLKKGDLKKNKQKKIVSKKASGKASSRSNLKGFLIRPRGKRKRRKPQRYK